MAALVKRWKTPEEDAERVRVRRSRLIEELGTTLNKPDESDVTFVCNDGKEVYAFRWLLSLRSPFFKAMFGSQMLESKSAEVSLVQFSSAAMLVVFEYLYTGAVSSHPILNWKMGFEIISAGHFFGVRDLEQIAQGYLWEKVSHVKNECFGRSLVMEMLCETLEFQEDWEEKDALLLELTHDLCTDRSLEEDDFQKLSENAMDYVLSKRSSDENVGRENPPSVEEYYTFREIVLWHVYRELPALDTVTQERLRKALPIEYDDSSLWSTVLISPVDIDECIPHLSFSASVWADPAAVLNSMFGIEIPTKSFERFLTYVDWFRIPAVLLLKVVCRLGVIPPSALLKALAVHALHRAVEPFPYGPYRWMPFESSIECLACEPDGQVAFKSDDVQRGKRTRGTAVAVLPIIMESQRTYKWHVEIQRKDYAVLSIMGGSGKELGTMSRLDEHSMGRKARAVLVTYRSENPIMCIIKFRLEDDIERRAAMFHVKQKKSSVVRFRLNAAEKTCHVSFGNFSAIVWRNLPDAVYHPAITVREGGCVRFKAISGFEPSELVGSLI